jgi:hypothetical protein
MFFTHRFAAVLIPSSALKLRVVAVVDPGLKSGRAEIQRY